ncbi:MAG: type II 3-dehydroquinate dehydratase [Alphaproteobacteria bacterium]|nr:MAG: type II 3-dehydroquinate dehydratase [Alphaproteobacteria bacterium]
MTASVLILNGPNLNLLGTRQPEVYGRTTLAELEEMARAHGKKLGLEVHCAQSNSEGALIDAIHAAVGRHDALIFNPGGYSHSSIALMDAILSTGIPTVEVHLSNIHAREEFRHNSFIARAAIGQICGFGPASYILALEAISRHLTRS